MVPAPHELFTEEMARAMAVKMGEGVRLVSTEKIRDGRMDGIKALYAFDDISRVRVSQKPQGAPGGGPGGPLEEISFGFEKLANGNAILTAHFPEFKAPSVPAPGADGPNMTPPDPQTAEMMTAMMKPLMKGFRIDMAIEVDGRLVRTTSPYTAGPRVTLLSMDFDKMLGGADAFSRLQRGATGSIEDAKRAFQGLPGIQMVLEPRVTIEFAAK